jgi:hypothetical protein
MMKYLSLIILIVVIQACSAGTSLQEGDNAQNAQDSTTLTSKQTNHDLCEWFVQTQIIRTERIADGSSIDDWLAKYGVDGLDINNDLAMQEFLLVLQEGLPIHQQFIEEWNVLGSVPGGEAFFENEKKSIENRIQGFERMISGINQRDGTEFNQGVNLLIQSGDYFSISESEMLKILNKCVEYFD